MNFPPSPFQAAVLSSALRMGLLVFSRKRPVLEDGWMGGWIDGWVDGWMEQRNPPEEVQLPQGSGPTAETHATGGLSKPH